MKATPFIIAMKNKTKTWKTSIKEVKCLYNKNYKTLMKRN
jgi:hypothetical protein